MFYNTTHETNPELKQYRESAETQDQAVLKIFEDNQYTAFTPSEVHRTFGPTVPITSIRRALTNLTQAGKLVKTNAKRQGPYGRYEYCWKIATSQRELF